MKNDNDIVPIDEQDTLSQLPRVISDQHTAIDPSPNGGWISWGQVLGAHVITFFVWGFVNSFGMFQAYYSSKSLSTSSNIAWIGSLPIWLLMFIPLFSGSAADAGYYKTVLRLGIFVYLLGVFMTSICKTYWQILLAQGICIGAANGLMFVPTISVVATYFDQSRRSFAIGVVLCGASSGGMVIPVMLNRLIDRIGFAWAVRSYGLMALVLLVSAQFLLKKRLTPKHESLLEFSSLKDVVFVLFIMGAFLNWIALYFAYFFVNTYARQTFNLTLEESIPLLLVMNGVGIPGRLVSNYMGDRFRPILVTIPLNLFISIMVFVWIGVKTRAGMYVFAVFYGFPAGGIQSLFPATLASLTIDPKTTGTRLGWGFAISSFGMLIGNPIGGALIQLGNGNYLYAQIFAGLCLALGCMTITAAATMHARKKKRNLIQ